MNRFLITSGKKVSQQKTNSSQVLTVYKKSDRIETGRKKDQPTKKKQQQNKHTRTSQFTGTHTVQESDRSKKERKMKTINQQKKGTKKKTTV
jgi:hypothetical protein